MGPSIMNTTSNNISMEFITNMKNTKLPVTLKALYVAKTGCVGPKYDPSGNEHSDLKINSIAT